MGKEYDGTYNFHPVPWLRLARDWAVMIFFVEGPTEGPFFRFFREKKTMKLHLGFDACLSGTEWLDDQAGPATAWHDCHRGDWMAWTLASSGVGRDRLLKLVVKYWYIALADVSMETARIPRLMLDAVTSVINLRIAGGVGNLSVDCCNSADQTLLDLVKVYWAHPSTDCCGNDRWLGTRQLVSMLLSNPTRRNLASSVTTASEMAATAFEKESTKYSGTRGERYKYAMRLFANEARIQFSTQEVIKLVNKKSEEFESASLERLMKANRKHLERLERAAEELRVNPMW